MDLSNKWIVEKHIVTTIVLTNLTATQIGTGDRKIAIEIISLSRQSSGYILFIYHSLQINKLPYLFRFLCPNFY